MSDAELENFKTAIDLRAYAATQGYVLDRKDSWRGSAVMRHPNNDKIIIKRDSDSHWVYFSVRQDGDSGTVIDFVKRRPNISLGAARKELRTFLGLPASSLPTYPALPKIAKDRIRVERVYERMCTANNHPYLEKERLIPTAVLRTRRFAGRIRIDNRGNAVFPHFDVDGLCGFELKNIGFTGFSTGGAKGLWSSHIVDGDTHFIVCESGIECLSHAVLFPNEEARYASLGGKPSPLQREMLRKAAAGMPENGTVVAAMNADAPGRELADIVRDAVRLTGRSDLRYEMQEPQGFKDWNDQLRGQRSRIHPPARPGGLEVG